MHAIESWISLCTTYTRGRYVLVTVSLRDPLATASSRARAPCFCTFSRTYLFLFDFGTTCAPLSRTCDWLAVGGSTGTREEPSRAFKNKLTPVRARIANRPVSSGDRSERRDGTFYASTTLFAMNMHAE